MSQLTDEEILEKAQDIAYKNHLKKESDKEEAQKKWAASMLNKYFWKDYGQHSDKDGFEIWRVIGLDWYGRYAQTEHWQYSHQGHYFIRLENFYNPTSIEFLTEITEIEFLQKVALFMKKLGVFQIFNKETNH